MFVIRQSSTRDVDAIFEVAEHLDTVNLPANRDQLEKLVSLSVESFSGAIPNQEREYLFVLEETETGRVIGTSMIHAQHGTRRAPHVYFDLIKEERYSETLDRYFVHQCLRLGYDYDGPTEIGGLILLPEFRGNPAQLGKLLSYTRFLFIGMHRPVFRDRVLSELLPPLEEDGTSVLWEHLGRKFTGLGYQEADLLSKHNKEFIKSLFPHGIIYTSLFPAEVQAVVGAVGPETRGVEKILRRIGFEYVEQIDPFDGGPHFVARTDEITLVAGTKRAQVADGNEAPEAAWSIVAADSSPTGFRALGVRAPRQGDQILLPAATRDALSVHPGDEVYVVTP